ncbi:MAG: hypothetical protein AAFO91_00565, partial [Bacteroidota bacterium]
MKILLFIFLTPFVVLQAQEDYLYILENSRGSIIRMNTDGDLESMHGDRLSRLSDIEFDPVEQKIYWLNPKSRFENCRKGELLRADVNGSNVELVLESDLLYDPDRFTVDLALDISNDKVYVLVDGDILKIDMISHEIM